MLCNAFHEVQSKILESNENLDAETKAKERRDFQDSYFEFLVNAKL